MPKERPGEGATREGDSPKHKKRQVEHNPHEPSPGRVSPLAVAARPLPEGEGLNLEGSNPIVLAIGDVESSCVKENGMRAGQLAHRRISVRTIAAHACSYCG